MRRLIMTALCAGAISAATPALAEEICEDLWLTRNSIMDRAGACFSSTLGKSLFDNAGCSRENVTLSAADQRQIKAINRYERELNCAVDTSKTSFKQLPSAEVTIRLTLADFPVRSEFESSCSGWKDGKTPLYAGLPPATGVVGHVENGDFVLFEHEMNVTDAFVTVFGPDDAFKAAGWMRMKSVTSKSCKVWAG